MRNGTPPQYLLFLGGPMDGEIRAVLPDVDRMAIAVLDDPCCQYFIPPADVRPWWRRLWDWVTRKPPAPRVEFHEVEYIRRRFFYDVTLGNAAGGFLYRTLPKEFPLGKSKRKVAEFMVFESMGWAEVMAAVNQELFGKSKKT